MFSTTGRTSSLSGGVPPPGADQQISQAHVPRTIALRALLVTILLFNLSVYSDSRDPQKLQNGGFESSRPAEFWQIDTSQGQNASIAIDHSDAKQGNQSLLISATDPMDVVLRQELFLPVGTVWRLTGWAKFSSLHNSSGRTPQIGIETPVGDQGFSDLPALNSWQMLTVIFRVPSPGRVTVALKPLRSQSGKVWLDDIRLEPVQESLAEQAVKISGTRLSQLTIDLKQGGQFIEPLCDLMPSMIAQQVQSTSFEDETAWTQSYKREIDRPYRPWYPDGSVHVAKYSFDSERPFHGKRSQKIELPVAHTWAGISQDGFYLVAQHSYRLHLHSRGTGNVRIRASLHGDGVMTVGPVSLGNSTQDWSAADVLLTANRTIANATLTIEFEGPGTLWLDRISLIDAKAVLGLWRPDVVEALRAMHPGIVRFGGTTVESFEWQDTVGPWDSRQPYADDPWGGLQENFVGLEEFIQLVQFIGAEPLICIRWTGKSPEDAAHEIEYVNGAADSEWGRKRAHNGHPAPYNVKYWQIGNEIGAPEYNASLQSFAKAMRLADPSIKIFSSFPTPDTVRAADGQLDYLSPHHYSVADLSGAEEEFKQLREEIRRDGNGKDIRVAVTEWNTTGGEFGLTRGLLLTLGNALSLSRYQNLLHRYSDLVEISNRSNFSDSFGSGAIQPGPGWIYFAPAYFSQRLYQRAAGSFALKIDRESPLPFYLQEPDFDATISADRKTLRIYGVNSTPDVRAVRFQLAAELGSVSSGREMVEKSTSSIDSEAMNSRDQPNRVSVIVHRAPVNGKNFKWQFPPFSITLLELELAPPQQASAPALGEKTSSSANRN